MNSRTGKLVRWMLALAYALTLFILSVAAPGNLTVKVVSSLPGRSIGAHILIYIVLAFLLCVALIDEERPGWIRRTASAFILAALYGAMLEFFQAFSASRTAALADILYNAIGALIGCAAWMALEFALSRLRARRIRLQDKGEAPDTGPNGRRKNGAEVVI